MVFVFLLGQAIQSVTSVGYRRFTIVATRRFPDKIVVTSRGIEVTPNGVRVEGFSDVREALNYIDEDYVKSDLYDEDVVEYVRKYWKGGEND